MNNERYKRSGRNQIWQHKAVKPLQTRLSEFALRFPDMHSAEHTVAVEIIPPRMTEECKNRRISGHYSHYRNLFSNLKTTNSPKAVLNRPETKCTTVPNQSGTSAKQVPNQSKPSPTWLQIQSETSCFWFLPHFFLKLVVIMADLSPPPKCALQPQPHT